MPSDVPPALRALLDVGGALLGGSANGRVALGRVAGLVPAEGIPPWLVPLEARLARARAEASEPLPSKRVERILRDAWGQPPARVLDALDLDAPAAVTPLAQVHRGELDGAPVAVKVRRPGLDAAIRADLALLDALRPPLGVALPGLDSGRLLARIREQALDELDLEHEAAQQRAVRRALARVDGVVVPAAHGELAAPDVSVSDWLAAPSLAEARPDDPDPVARALVAAHVTAARAGLILIDPRPNHVRLLPGGAVGLLGTGTAVAGDRARLAALLALPAALRDDDPDAFATLVAGDLALLPDRERAVAAHTLLRELLGPIVGGAAQLDGATAEAVARRARVGLPAIFALLGAAAPDPADVWLGRGTLQLAAVLAQLGAREDWIALVG